MKKLLFVFMACVMALGIAWAQTPFTATYTFPATQTTPFIVSMDYNGTAFDGIVPGAISKVGVTATGSGSNFRASNWPIGATSGSDVFTGSVDTGKYIGFSISAASGYIFTISSITFGVGRSGTGTRQSQWRGSADSYATLLSNYTALNGSITNTSGVLTNPDGTLSYNGNTLTLGAEYLDIATSAGFRFYLFNCESTGGTGGLQGPITISGTYEQSGGTPIASTPAITPVSGNYYTAFNASITCSTEDATIYYSTDGVDPDDGSEVYSAQLNITGNTVLKAIAYSDGYDPSPVATATYTFPVINEVADIATLRAGTVGTTVYKLTGEAILTFQQTTNHTKFLQDDTAAIYIYDVPGLISTSYNLGDGITGIMGTLALYNSLLELIPVADPGAPTSTGNVVTPEVRTLVSLTSADQSKLIKVENVTLDTALGNFGTGAQSINATQDATTLTMRTFAGANYGGTAIPTTPQDITCLAGQFGTAMQISPRFLSDFANTYDFPAGIPVVVGDETITISGGNANYGTGGIPGVNNGDFTALGSYNIELIGAGPWTITIETTAPWGAYYRNNTWIAVQNVGGFIVFNIEAAKDLNVPIVLGDQDPTLPVELSSFTATITTDLCVKIAWLVQSETNHSGYNLLRAEASDLATAIKINPTLINDGTNLGTQITYSYTDVEAFSNMVYNYWLESISLDGTSEFFGPIIVTIGDPSQDPLPPAIPMLTQLINAYPNPFNPNTNIRYSMKDSGKVKIAVYNLRGQLVRSFNAEHNAPGYYQVSWDGCDATGNPVSSGIYMYRMSSGKYSSAKKMILAK